MKASDLFVKCLEAEGVTKIFGIPGEENADLKISLKKSKIGLIKCIFCIKYFRVSFNFIFIVFIKSIKYDYAKNYKR